MKRPIRIAVLLLVILALAVFGLRRVIFHPGTKLPPAVLQCLHAPLHMTLYSIDPTDRLQEHSTEAGRFHDCKVLGETVVISPDARRLIAQTIEHATSSWDGRFMMCFEPRHGIRITDRTQTFDLLICFECQRIYCFSGEKELGLTGLTGSQAPLDDHLRRAHIALPKQASE